MNDNDKYLTIKSFAQGIYKEKGSRFIAHAFPVARQEEVKPIIDRIKKEYHDAKHHCFAYVIGLDRLTWRVNDDGEPSGTAGKPIIGQINSANLTNIMIVVVRYFGGTLLGVSGLINAYRTAAAAAIKNSEIIEMTLHEYYEVRFQYGAMNEIMKVLKEEGATQSDQKMDLECSMKISFRVSVKEKILGRLSRIEGLKMSYIGTH